MAKFFGEVGYASSVQFGPGVWKDVIIEKPYFGDVIRNASQLQDGQNVNSDLTVSNSISIVSNDYANENFIAIRYVRWAGALWTVTNVEVQIPRLILRLGGVYNGPTA